MQVYIHTHTLVGAVCLHQEGGHTAEELAVILGVSCLRALPQSVDQMNHACARWVIRVHEGTCLSVRS